MLVRSASSASTLDTLQAGDEHTLCHALGSGVHGGESGAALRRKVPAEQRKGKGGHGEDLSLHGGRIQWYRLLRFRFGFLFFGERLSIRVQRTIPFLHVAWVYLSLQMEGRGILEIAVHIFFKFNVLLGLHIHQY